MAEVMTRYSVEDFVNSTSNHENNGEVSDNRRNKGNEQRNP